MFRTIIDNKDVKEENKLLRNISGRLPNLLCDFFLPLINANLIEIRGHIAYDIGAVGIFVDVPISLHILVSKQFLMLTENSMNNINNNIKKNVTNKRFQNIGNNNNIINGNINGDNNDNNNNNNNDNNNHDDHDRIKFLENKNIEREKEKEIMDHANDLLLWYV